MKIDYNKLEKVHWYRQATDSVNYFILGPSIAVQRLIRAGFNLIISSKTDHWRGYINEEYYFALAKKELGRFREDHKYLKRLRRRWISERAKLHRFIEEVRKLRIDSLSNERLIKLNRRLGRAAFDIWLIPFFLDIFDPNADFFIEWELKNAGKKLRPEEISILLQPNLPLAVQEYHLALLLFLKRKGAAPDITKIIDNFYFINCSYADGSGLTYKSIKEDMKNLYDEANLDREIKKLKKYTKIILAEKQAVYQRHRFPRRLVHFMIFFATLGQWRDERKVTLQKTVFGLNLLGKEIARRSNLPWAEVNLCPPYVIDSIPVKQSLIEHYRKRTRDNYMQIWDPKLKKPVFFDKQTSIKLSHFLTPRSRLVEIRGQPAHLGRVEGTIRMIRGEKDFKKFREKEILVTSMTRPEFLPIMKKAAAIVTDEGGVTSHAAIISRELRIPCIIGTKIATKAFKDGDLVEVNANHGWVRRISK